MSYIFESHITLIMNNNRICKLFGIELPIVAGGMVWCSGWRLAAAVSNAGGLGLLGAGSMHPDTLREHIHKTKAATSKPWGVNIPLMYPDMENLLDIIVEEGVKIVYTQWFHEHGILVAHVVSSSKFAKKCEEAGVDAIVAEGFEAGGHNGREESTTMTLIPQVRKATTLPLIAAGGIASGQAMVAAMALGAEGVQIGTAFALTKESSAAEAFKLACISANEGDTMLCLKKIAPSRLLRNQLFNRIAEAEANGASADELRALLGEKSTKRGIFEGDIENGEIEIGQIASSISSIDSVADCMSRIMREYQETIDRIKML